MSKKVNDLIMYTELDACLTQMSARKGFHKHDERAIQSVLNKFTQFNGKNVISPLDPDTLYTE